MCHLTRSSGHARCIRRESQGGSSRPFIWPLGAMETMLTHAETTARDAVRSYALALLIFAAAIIARILLDYVVPERLPFITFFPAVLLAAYYCGLAPSRPCPRPVRHRRNHLERPDRSEHDRLLRRQLSAFRRAFRRQHCARALFDDDARSAQAAGPTAVDGSIASSSTASRTSSRSPTRFACKRSSQEDLPKKCRRR